MKTNPSEFILFHKLLMLNASVGYIPYYFPVVKHNKAPDGIAISKRAPKQCCGQNWIYDLKEKKWICPVCKASKGGWKNSWALLNYNEALDRLNKGYNVGIASRKDDPLCIVDIDSFSKVSEMPDSLIVSSRKKIGYHGFFWWEDLKPKINIPTDYGEVRASDQYVVAAGSFCETSEHDVKEEKLDPVLESAILENSELGLYTIFREKAPNPINFEKLPQFFKEAFFKVEKEKPIFDIKKNKMITSNDKQSALFKLKISDIISIAPNRREPHPLHESDTGMNFSITGDLAHCWRHNVSLNAIQFLTIKSGYMTCQEAGTGHKNSGAGSSAVIGNDGAIFHAWLEAKKCGLIPEDDPTPFKALRYIAKKHNLLKNLDSGILPNNIYYQVLEILEKKY